MLNAVAGLGTANGPQTLDAITRHYKVGLNTPWDELPKKVKDVRLD